MFNKLLVGLNIKDRGERGNAARDSFLGKVRIIYTSLHLPLNLKVYSGMLSSLLNTYTIIK